MLNNPKAIFLAGPAGSGKSYISKGIPNKNKFTLINIDDTYEELLKSSGLGLDQSNFSPENLSQAAKLMAQATKQTKEKFETKSEEGNNLIIDGTGASSNQLLKKKNQLETLGYDTLLIMLYVSPHTSLLRNQQRERSLLPSIILRTWNSVNKNIDIYRKEFGDNFVLINNDPKDAKKGFSQDLIKPFFDKSNAIGKPKTPEQEKNSKIERDKLYNEIHNILKNTPKFNSLQSAKQKINNFIK